MKRKILITVGGTGGHVYPAQALAKQLCQSNPDAEILFVGGGLKKNRYFEKSAFPFQEVSCGSFSLFKPLTSLKNFGNIISGIIQSRRLIRDFKPDLIVGFGSYYTLPTLLAAKMESKIPIILHEANREPGRVNRLLSKYVSLTAVHFPDTSSKLKGKTVTANIPLRDEYKRNKVSADQAKSYFHLEIDRKTLLIFGGSQGAQGINRLVIEAIPLLDNATRKQLQILHFTGDNRFTNQAKEIYEKYKIPSSVKDFETRMELAWQAADLMISRSGAGTLAEQLEFEVPGILIPYPHATDDHQNSNAEYMCNVVGGAEKYLEKDLTAEKLAAAITQMIEENGYRLLLMQEAMRDYKLGFAAREFREIIEDYINNNE